MIKKFKLFLESISSSEELMDFLKSNFKTGEVSILKDKPAKKWIEINYKTTFIEGNKKYLVNKISSLVESDFKSLDISVIRKTVKDYLNEILTQDLS